MTTKKFLSHLKKEIRNNFWQYLLFFIVSLFFLLSFFLAKESRSNQFLIITLFVIFYIFWGAVHHYLDHTLNLKIVVEYILIGFIVLFLLKILFIP